MQWCVAILWFKAQTLLLVNVANNNSYFAKGSFSHLKQYNFTMTQMDTYTQF